MALRLQDSEEDKTHFVRSLPGPYRAFYFWLKRACDHAGIWEIDIDEARMRTGFFDLDTDIAASLFTKKIVKLPCGEKFFLIDFAAEQLKTTELNYANTYHRGVINIFNKLDVFNLTNLYSIKEAKPLQSGLEATKDKDIDKDMLIDNTILLEVSKGKTKSVPKIKKEAPIPVKTYNTPLVQAMADYREMRKKKKSVFTDAAAKMMREKLQALAGDDEALKVAIINQSTFHGWPGVFPLKQDVSKPVGKIVDMSSVAVYKPIDA